MEIIAAGHRDERADYFFNGVGDCYQFVNVKRFFCFASWTTTVTDFATGILQPLRPRREISGDNFTRLSVDGHSLITLFVRAGQAGGSQFTPMTVMG